MRRDQESATMSELRMFALSALLLLAPGAAALAGQPPITASTLVDRAQIEDLLVDYYSQLGSGRGAFGDFYTADGVLDVNGLVAQGQHAIEQLYRQVAQGTPRRPGTFRMLLTNLKIVVNGDSATADVIWTGVNSVSVKALPQILEQG